MLINLFCYQNSLYHKNSFCLKFKWHRERRQNLEEKSVLNLLTKFQNSQQVLHYWYSSPVWKIVTAANIYCIVAFSFDFEQRSRHSIPEGSFFIASKPFKTVNSNGLRQIPCLVRTNVRWVFHHCLVSTLELFSITQTVTGSKPGHVENRDHYNSDTMPID